MPTNNDNKAETDIWQINSHPLPPPAGASNELYSEIAANSQPDPAVMQVVPGSESEWLEFIAADDAVKQAEVQATIDQSPVSVERKEIAGVAVYSVIPDEIDPIHEDHLFVHVHGGAYVLNGGIACTGAGRSASPALLAMVLLFIE